MKVDLPIKNKAAYSTIGSLALGVNTVTDMVKLTMGPMGKNVLIERGNLCPTVTKDGVTVAQSMVFKNPLIAAGAAICKDVSSRTDAEAGDGTTTSLVLLQSILNAGIRLIAAGYSPVDLSVGMFAALEDAIAELTALSIPITSAKMLIQTATLSAKDEEIGGMIAECMEKVGLDIKITVKQSHRQNTFIEITQGLELTKGFISPTLIGKGEGRTCELEDAYLLLHSGKVDDLNAIEKILDFCTNNKKSLLIIAGELSRELLSRLKEINKQGTVAVTAVQAPGGGMVRLDILSDIAIYTGSSVFDPMFGNDLSHIASKQLGGAERIAVSGGNTLITGGKGDPEQIKSRMEQIKILLSGKNSAAERTSLESRLTMLNGAVAVIQVGGSTEAEMKERKYRVEDAIGAATAGLRGGVLPGGGKAFWWAAEQLQSKLALKKLPEDIKQGYEIVIAGLRQPLLQIVANAGIDITPYLHQFTQDQPWTGFSVVDERMLDLAAAGILDPCIVTLAALKSSVSGAAMALTCETFVSEPTKALDMNNYDFGNFI
ncbi:chaperonin GroEL [Desulfitobacterium sp.]|uniref:chaperonin GroEL n=1 Tax=Desulfitobacterium sp. TaxID=49981 RepID=UPI002B207380|nr:chaperonin GroEL [Desulfitobacterium sp.]MEA4901606.1 chaperonin GroEL [Desulfitobacterium sp.]